jgi:hypothetical protein
MAATLPVSSSDPLDQNDGDPRAGPVISLVEGTAARRCSLDCVAAVIRA